MATEYTGEVIPATEYTGEVIPATEYNGAVIPEDFLTKLKAKAQNLANRNVGIGGAIAGLGETGLQMLTGTGASAIGGLKGLYDVTVGGKTPEEASQSIAAIQQAGTYQPRSLQGKTVSSTVGKAFEGANNAVGYLGGKVGGLFGEQGAIAGQSIGEVAIPIGTTLLGARTPASSIAKDVMAGRVLPTKPNIPPMPHVPIMSDIIAAGRGVARSYLPNGAARTASEAIRSKVSYDEAQKIINAQKTYGAEIVPGSPVTTADVIARANEAQTVPDRFGGNLVSLQARTERAPDIGTGLKNIDLTQKQARSNLLDSRSGSEQAYQAAIDARKAAANPFYAAVDTSTATVDVKPTLNMIQTLQSVRTGEPILLTALDTVKAALSDEKGNPRTNVAQIDSAIQGINQAMTSPGVPKGVIDELMNLKDDLTKRLTAAEPAYGDAIQAYKDNSVPINQMDMWRFLRQKAIDSTGVETSKTLLTALRDQQKAINAATGFKRGTSINDMFGDQAPEAAKLIAEITSNSYKKQMAKELDLGTSFDVKAPKLEMANLLNAKVQAVKWVVSVLGRNQDVPVGQAAAKLMANPKLMAAELAKIPPPYRSKFMSELKNVIKDPNVYPMMLQATNQQGQQP